MAKRTLVVLSDDLTGDVLPENGGETVTFSLDGTTYEIDLSHENSKVMRQMLSTYVDRARRVGVGHPHTRRRTGQGNNREAATIREWAVTKGLMAEGSRGRIPREVREAYHNRSAIEKVTDDAHKVVAAGEQATVHQLPEFTEPRRGRKQPATT